MEITTKYHRYNTIYKWKSRGVIYPDYDELYQTYINTLECQHCLKEFITTRDRCLDHCHITGQFRKFVCQQCNVNDTYIKYPDGYTDEDRIEHCEKYRKQNVEHKKKYDKDYRKNNKEKIKELKNQKYDCECGGKYSHCAKSKHLKTKKHKKYLDNNN